MTSVNLPKSQQEVDYILWRVERIATQVLDNKKDTRVEQLAADAITLVHLIREGRKPQGSDDDGPHCK
jgi:hypothetical protein